MEKIRGNYVILNGKVESALYFESRADSTIVYEVIRLFPQGFMFPEDHFMRMQESCASCGLIYPGNAVIWQQLERLLEASEIKEGNVKVQLYLENGKQHLVSFFVPHHYPTEKEISEGVKLMSFSFERPDPQVKQWYENFRKEVRAFIREKEIYEAALLDHSGKLTEGSRSNLFFVDEHDRLITAPDELVLGGITRKYVLEICRDEGIEVIKKQLSMEEAAKMKSCFLTGTSPLVLAVKSLDDINYLSDYSLIHHLRSSLIEKAQN